MPSLASTSRLASVCGFFSQSGCNQARRRSKQTMSYVFSNPPLQQYKAYRCYFLLCSKVLVVLYMLLPGIRNSQSTCPAYISFDLNNVLKDLWCRGPWCAPNTNCDSYKSLRRRQITRNQKEGKAKRGGDQKSRKEFTAGPVLPGK